MKRLLAITAVLLLAMGAGVVFWPTGDDEVKPSPDVVAPQKPKRTERAVAAPVIAPQLVPGTVAGGVHRHGKGVVGARVIARGDRETVVTTTGEGGGFLLSVPPDSYLISATFEDEASRVVGPLFVGAAEQKQGVVLELLPSATLEGVVLNEQTREPVAGARVLVAGNSAVTTAAGRFELKGVSVGEAWVEVSAKGFMRRIEWVTVDAARRLSGMEIVLTPSAMVLGTVTRAGAPVAGARVWAEGDSRIVTAVSTAATITDANGAFELEVSAGKSLLAAAAANEGRVEGPAVAVAPGARLEGVQIELGQQLLVRGVVSLDADPAPSAQLSIFDARTGKFAGSAVADLAGRFEVLGLPPGPYLVQARVLGVDAQRGPFQVTGAEDHWSVVLERAGVVRGRVMPPQAGTVVRIRGTDWVGGGAATMTDAEGRFLFEGITDESILEAEGEAGFAEGRAKPNEEVVLTLEQAIIKGSVSNEHGRAVTDFAIRLRPLKGGASRTHAVLSPTGRFRIQANPGDYEVSAFAAGSAWAEPVRGTAARGGTAADVNLKLSQTTKVGSRLVDAQTRSPVAGADVQVRIGGAFSAMVFARAVTGSDGSFNFTSVPTSAGIVAFATGYKPRYLAVGAFGTGKFPEIPLERGEAPEWLRSYEGVGISWQNNQPALTVNQVFPGSPAEEAGVLPGDVLYTVEGRQASTMRFNDIIDAIRGPAGTAVRLGFIRDNVPYEVAVRRRAISL